MAAELWSSSSSSVMASLLLAFASAAAASAAATAPPDASTVVLTQPDGQRVRVHALSATMVRVEAEGPKSWEDRPTFLVQNRSFGGAAPVALRKQSATRAASAHWAVEVGLADPEAGPVAVFGPSSGRAHGQEGGRQVGDRLARCQEAHRISRGRRRRPPA
eukprot:COSAG04_NODE_3850_length_2475_cov_14.757576_3_plen_160_part_01